MVKRPFYLGRTTILVGGIVVAQTPRPTLSDPWVECELPGSVPPVNVVQVQTDIAQFTTLVFVNGVSLDGGMPIDVARSQKPATLDGFEQRFFRRDNSWPALAGWSSAGVFLYVVALVPGPVVPKVVIAVVAAAILFGWGMLTYAFMRWLRGRRSWPSGLRTVIVILQFLVLPLLVIAGLASMAGGQ